MQQLIVLRGPIGAGKSTIASELRGRVPYSSVIEIDAIKRMIDPNASSPWRRDAVLQASYTLARTLLEHGRSVITETHSRWPEQAEQFAAIARAISGTVFSSVLVYTSLKTCLERASGRDVPGITYDIDKDMISSYYVGLCPVADELAIDTSTVTAEQAAEQIAQTLIVHV